MTLARALQVAAGNGQETGDIAEAIDFDGTNDYLSRSSDLVGNADGKTFTFSAWFWYDGTATGYIYREYVAGQGYFHCRIESSGKVAFAGGNTAGTAIFLAEYDLAVLPPFKQTFYHILVSVDLANTANRYWYVNDQLVSPAWTIYSNQNIDFTTAAHAVGANVTGADKFDGRLSNVFLDYTYRDLSITANRRLFVTADLKPAAGQAALNPILYLPMNDPTAPGVNAGTGGNFTLTGTVARSGRGPNQYNAPYSDLDGAADYLSRTTAPTGIADGKQFTFQCVLNTDVIAQGFVLSFGGTTSGIRTLVVRTDSSNQIEVSAQNSSVTSILLGVGPVLAIGRNYVITISIDLADTAKRHIYLNGQAASVTWTTYTNDNIDFTVPNYRVGVRADALAGYVNGRLGALWFNTSYIDLSVAANLAKFVTGTGIDAKPVDLGANGELPTGTSPLIYLPMYGNNAGKNYGTGGDFTVNSGPYTGARGPNEYWGNKADFNGATGYLSRTSALAGIADSKTFSVSFNYNPDTIPAGQDYIFAMSNGTDNRGIFIQLSSNNLRFFAYTSAGVNILIASVTSPTLVAGTNYSVQASVDLANTSNRAIYINGAAATVTWSTYTNSTINHTASTQRIGAAADGSAVDFIDGKLSEFYFTTDYIDFSQEANRLKFRDAFGNPVNLTQQIEDAAIPNPAIYMRFPPTAFGTNYGTGGDFTVNGTITDGGQL